MLLTFKSRTVSSVSLFLFLFVHLWLYMLIPQNLTDNSLSLLTWGLNRQLDIWPHSLHVPYGSVGLPLPKKRQNTHTYTLSLRGSGHSSIWRCLWLSVSVNLHLQLDWQQLQEHKPVGTSGVTDWTYQKSELISSGWVGWLCINRLWRLVYSAATI